VRARLLACKIGAVGCNTDASLSRAMSTSRASTSATNGPGKLQKHAHSDVSIVFSSPFNTSLFVIDREACRDHWLGELPPDLH